MTEHALMALTAVRKAVAAAQQAGQLAEFLGALEAVRIEVLLSTTLRVEEDPEIGDDRLLSASETADRIGMSVWWVRANKDALPIVRLPTKRYGFSAKGLERWLRRRSS